ncbi:MAG: NAD(P)H-dependent oxidoreductase [Synergistaceae bacterium]|nr:NAD(P)H-dependent oxidoreductase [Synergistaceae bacterium]MBQ4401250.1 NAD(P)H-dependent oxidoreductase [Synergistaceae bacterium]MBQ6114353.1 NAD(P)H-dependent oxidoreductase [Synergistaceae bacterium]MBQ6417851.1 NAD(P)H-dependent oxidoreductase [Synergistaceae bacterium]MBQ6981540.1 NAD(P)H-dependent oxidoreductase [Synergistaceae bacterium]
MPKTLIVYFSKSGRTKAVAETIAGEISAPLYEIVTEKKYPRTYVMTIIESRKEFKRNEKPALVSPKVEDFASYDRIILGFPIWFWTCPMAVVSWLEQYDFSGKEIYPFCTSGSSSCAKATEKIRELCSGANVHDGIKANTIDSVKIQEWLK